MQKPIIIAHRGASSLAPENTLLAARVAHAVGAQGWECDVQLTRDGELVLMHDSTLSRTTNVREVFPHRSPWRVSDFFLREIQKLDAGSWFITRDPFGTIASRETRGAISQCVGEKVPSLYEALSLSRELNLFLNIEIKPLQWHFLSSREEYMVRQVVEMVRSFRLERRTLISSFNREVIRYLGTIAPDVAGGLLIETIPSDVVLHLRRLGAVALHLDIASFDPSLPLLLSQANLGLFLWTVDERSRLSQLVTTPGVTGIITNWPQWCSEEEAVLSSCDS